MLSLLLGSLLSDANQPAWHAELSENRIAGLIAALEAIVSSSRVLKEGDDMVFEEIVEIHVARMGYCGKISFQYSVLQTTDVYMSVPFNEFLLII